MGGLGWSFGRGLGGLPGLIFCAFQPLFFGVRMFTGSFFVDVAAPCKGPEAASAAWEARSEAAWEDWEDIPTSRLQSFKFETCKVSISKLSAFQV